MAFTNTIRYGTGRRRAVPPAREPVQPMKLIVEPVQVRLHDGEPLLIRWRGRTYRVKSVVERWLWRSRWWMDNDLRGEVRHYMRVICAEAQFDLFERNGEWFLSRVLD